LKRGQLLTELLKQGQYLPMPVQDQVLVLFAGVGGYMDAIQVEHVRTYEESLLKHVKENHVKVLEQIRTEKDISPSLNKEMSSIITNFTAKFIASVK